jgi:hypothetical protein
MVSLSSLWLPILLSAVVVFVASFVTHMVLRYHWSDFRKLPAEDDVMEALRRFNLPPGDYIVPHAPDAKAMQAPEFTDKLNRGPVMTTTIWKNGPHSMGGQLAKWFVFCALISLFSAYLASRTLGEGAEYLAVSQITSTTAFLGYTMARWADVIWFKRAALTTIKYTIDGVVYGLLTGGVFGWLWP